jgi:hypothetical protein
MRVAARSYPTVLFSAPHLRRLNPPLFYSSLALPNTQQFSTSSTGGSRNAKNLELGEVFGCGEEDVKKLVDSYPRILGFNVESLRAKFTELSEMTGCNEKAVGKMVAGFPRLLSYNTDSMRAKITELSEMTGCNEKAVGKMVAGFPPLLGMNADSMRVKLAFLLGSFGVTIEEVIHNVRLLSYSPSKRLNPRSRTITLIYN